MDYTRKNAQVVTSLQTSCYKSDDINKVVTSCYQLVPNLLTTWDKQCEHNLLTACWQACCKIYGLDVYTYLQVVL
jgi:hypothetical protein